MLKVNFNNETLPFCYEPKYSGVTLDWSFTYRRHLETLRKKLTSRVALLLRRLAGSGWGAEATTLRTATLALVHSTAEYCAPVWCLSAHTHLIDPTINDVLRIVTGCLRPTPADNLPILAGIQPAEFRRNGATLSIARRAMEPEYRLHSVLTHPLSANARRLKSRHPFVPAAKHLISSSDNNNICAAHWADHQWNAGRRTTPQDSTFSSPTLAPTPISNDLTKKSLGSAQPPPHLCRMFPLLLVQMGYMASSAACECGAEEQTVDHVVLQCPIHRPPHGLHGLTVLDDENRMAAQHLPRGLVRPSSG